MRWLISRPLSLLQLLLLVLLGVPVGTGLSFAAPPKDVTAKDVVHKDVDGTAISDVWQATLSDHDNAPGFLIAVGKKSQQVFAFERHSPMRLIAEYPCTTGQAEGDKIKNGDLKTPEGVYFVVRHITSGLNYTLYGKEAYPLNYPNPVDRLRKKTGYGIWIHGKGVPLAPRDTQGCVAMSNTDIASLGGKIVIGQPVTLAADIVHKPEMAPQRADTFALLERNVIDWAGSWSGRSAKMFDYYDAEAYSIAQRESFTNFRAQKERLFKNLPWINTTISDIQILEGPGYWVTWFNQDYRAPNLSTSGTRRLYWQKNDQGELRIVGMEWVPGLKSPVLLASAGKTPKIPTQLPPETGSTATLATAATTTPVSKTSASQTPVQDAPVVSAPLPVAAKGGETGATSGAGEPVVAAKTPEVSVASVVEAPETVQVAAVKPASETTKPEKSAPEQPVKVENKPVTVASVAKPSKQAPEAAVSKPVPAMPSAFEASSMLEQWRQAWEKGNLKAYMAFYAPDARQAGRGMRETAAQKQKLWSKARPARVSFEDVRITRTTRGFSVKMIQSYTDAKGYSDKGIKTMLLEADGTAMRIAREDWTPIP